MGSEAQRSALRLAAWQPPHSRTVPPKENPPQYLGTSEKDFTMSQEHKHEYGNHPYDKHPLKLPRHPDVMFSYDYVRFGTGRELVATCSRCQRRHRLGVHLEDALPESVTKRVKDRLHRYHICSPDGFAAMAERSGIEAVMDAFGFPDWLKPDDKPHAQHQHRWGGRHDGA